jgi:hypothetical protein
MSKDDGVKQLRSAVMTYPHRSITAALMAIVLVAGTIGFATAGLQDCLPKACCCMMSPHTTAPVMAEIDAKSGCSGNAPCCRLTAPQKDLDLAAPSSRPELPQSKSFNPAVMAGEQPATRPTSCLAQKFQHNGKPGAYRVPLYLEQQIFLC